MKILAAALVVFSSAAALSQTSFDDYFAANKKHGIGARQAAFLDACGVKRSAAQIVYGLSTGNEGYKFRRTPSLLTGRSEAETDFFGSAEEWKINGKPRFISTWMLIMDVGSESNEMFCLDENGKVTLQESLNASYDLMNGKAQWIYVQRSSFDAAGQKKVVRGGYLQKNGSPAAIPKLSRDDREASKGTSDASLATEVITVLAR